MTAEIVDSALDAGVNLIDTAESYSSGASEELLGRVLKNRRQDVILSTKTGRRSEPGSEVGGRLTRLRIIARLEASLRRLATDYVDLYYFHYPDPLTPIEESLRAVDDLIRAGKIRYFACSNYQAWQIAEIIGICEKRGFTTPVVVQNRYNLLNREIESELIPACAHLGLSVVPFYPLAAGFLTGKYDRSHPPPPGSRFHGKQREYGTYFTTENFDSLDRYMTFAEMRGHTVGELAIAWLLAQSVVCSVISGVTSTEQLGANMSALQWKLSSEDLLELA